MKKHLTLVLALITVLSMTLTGCGSSNSDEAKPESKSESASSVDTSSFKEITIEGVGHKVTYKYDKDAYEFETATMNTDSLVSYDYIADNLGSVTTTLTTFNDQAKTAEEAEKIMTSNENMMNNIHDYTCEPYSNSGLDGYVETYYNNTTNSATRYYVLTDGDFYMYIEVSYLLSDPFDLEFSVETI